MYAGITVLLWSTIATVSKLLLNSFTDIQVLCISAFFASLFFVLKNIITGKIKLLCKYGFKNIAIMSAIGIFGIFFYNWFYYIGAAVLPASTAFTVNYLWPVMSIVFAVIILKEKITVRKFIAVLVSLLGVAIVADGGNLTLNRQTVKGIVFIILAAAAYGLFTALNQKFNYDKGISVMVANSVTFAVSAVICIIEKQPLNLSFLNCVGLAWNGIFIMGVANMVWAVALEKGNTATVSNLAYITPFLSLVWTVLILKEKITVGSVVGLCVIVAGILIQIKTKPKTDRK